MTPCWLFLSAFPSVCFGSTRYSGVSWKLFILLRIVITRQNVVEGCRRDMCLCVLHRRMKVPTWLESLALLVGAQAEDHCWWATSEAVVWLQWFWRWPNWIPLNSCGKVKGCTATFSGVQPGVQRPLCELCGKCDLSVWGSESVTLCTKGGLWLSGGTKGAKSRRQESPLD